MRRSPFALLRGPDGRSLARALACLLLLNATLVGFHAGAMAAAVPDAPLCVVDIGGTPDETPPPGHAAPCCPDGLAGGTLTPPPAPAAEPPVHLSTTGPTVASTAVPTQLTRGAHRPRGPPILA